MLRTVGVGHRAGRKPHFLPAWVVLVLGDEAAQPTTARSALGESEAPMRCLAVGKSRVGWCHTPCHWTRAGAS